MIRRNVGGRKVASSIADLAFPPVLVGSVDDGDDVAAPELQLAGLLGREIVHGLHQILLGKR